MKLMKKGDFVLSISLEQYVPHINMKVNVTKPLCTFLVISQNINAKITLTL